jgi:hypothetical protein
VSPSTNLHATAGISSSHNKIWGTLSIEILADRVESVDSTCHQENPL